MLKTMPFNTVVSHKIFIGTVYDRGKVRKR